MNNTVHNEGLRLINLLLTNGYSEATLPLPSGKLARIEEGHELLDEHEVANLRLALAGSPHKP